MIELQYSLTPDDLHEGLRAVHLNRVQRLRRSPIFFALAVLAVGGLALPLCILIFRPFFGSLAIAVWLVIMAVATPIAFLISRNMSRKRSLMFPGMADWAVKRQLATALPRSTLGPITLRVSPSGLWRKNEKDELTVVPADVRRVIATPACLVVHLLRTNRIVVVPARVFADRTGFEDEVARAVGKPVER